MRPKFGTNGGTEAEYKKRLSGQGRHRARALEKDHPALVALNKLEKDFGDRWAKQQKGPGKTYIVTAGTGNIKPV